MFVINYIDETTLTRERVTEINASTNTLYAEVSTNFFFTAHIPCVSGDVVRGRYWSPISTYNVVIHKTDGTNVYASTLWTIDSSSRTKYGSVAWRAFMFTCPANTEYIIYNGLISELGVRAIVTINQDFPDTFVRGNTSANIDKTTLNTAITNASTNLNSVSISVNGSNIATTSYWITQSTHDTYASAISAAQSEYSSTSSTQTKVDSTVSALASATTTFNNSKAIGTYSTVVAVTGISLGIITSMVAGETIQLTATVSPSNASDKTLTWSSSNTSVATVNNTGLVTAIISGTVIITCTSNSNSSMNTTFSITVRANKSALSSAIVFTNTNLESVTQSTDGADADMSSYWVTSSVYNAYQTAIGVAQAEYDSTSSTTSSVSIAITNLASATTTFNNTKALGTKSYRLAESIKLPRSYENRIETLENNVSSIEYEIDGLQTQGSYVEEQSPNLLTLDCTSKTQYGVTFTVDLVNGKVTLNGTATTPFTHSLNSTPISVTKGDYKCINFGSTKAFTVSFKWTNSDNSIGSANLSTSPSYMIATAKLDGYFTSYVSISRGETFDNTVIKPFVYKGTYVARDFYVGGKINGIERSTQNGYLMANVFNKMNLNPNNFLKGIMSMPILTWIDDDFTTNYRKPDGALKANHGNVESVYEMCNSLGIKCTFAPMVGEFKTLPNAVTLAKQYHSKGFHFALHDGFWEEILWYQQNGFFDFQYNVAPGGAKTLAYQLSISQWAECNVNAGGIAKYNGNAENGRYNLERVFCNGADTDLATLKTAIDRTIVNGGWLIMGTHSNGWTNPNGSSWNYDITKAVLQYALDNGIKILPLNQAYRLRKPIYDFYDLYKGVMFNDGTLDASL